MRLLLYFPNTVLAQKIAVSGFDSKGREYKSSKCFKHKIPPLTDAHTG